MPPRALAALEGLGSEITWRHRAHLARELVLTWGQTRDPLLDLGEPRLVDRVVLGEHTAFAGPHRQLEQECSQGTDDRRFREAPGHWRDDVG